MTFMMAKRSAPAATGNEGITFVRRLHQLRHPQYVDCLIDGRYLRTVQYEGDKIAARHIDPLRLSEETYRRSGGRWSQYVQSAEFMGNELELPAYVVRLFEREVRASLDLFDYHGLYWVLCDRTLSHQYMIYDHGLARLIADMHGRAALGINRWIDKAWEMLDRATPAEAL